jgi:hypothetical protein
MGRASLVVPVFALVALIACWLNGDVRVHTKVIVTTIYLGSWGLLICLWLSENRWAFSIFICVQFVLMIVMGGIATGWDFRKDRR